VQDSRPFNGGLPIKNNTRQIILSSQEIIRWNDPNPIRLTISKFRGGYYENY
jgi:hypothetical protein